jgi:hypothetical protein
VKSDQRCCGDLNYQPKCAWKKMILIELRLRCLTKEAEMAESTNKLKHIQERLQKVEVVIKKLKAER